MMDEKHKNLVATADRSINKVFSDTSVDKRTTFESLKELRDTIDVLIDVIKVDMRNG